MEPSALGVGSKVLKFDVSVVECVVVKKGWKGGYSRLKEVLQKTLLL